MKGLFKFITLLLCVELIVQPIIPSGIIGIESAKAQDCPSGLSWNLTLNRCLTSVETAKVLNMTASCAPNDVQCYKTNAQAAFQSEVNKGTDGVGERKGSGFISKIGTISAIAVPVTVAGIGLSTSAASCLSPSFYAMVAGAAALVIGDNLANIQHKKRLKEIKKSWGDIIKPEQANGDKDKQRELSINAQSEAFEKLAQAEDSLVKAAKMKKTFFLVGTAAYGAATVMALMERKKSLAVSAVALASSATTLATTSTSATLNPEAGPAVSLATLAKTAQASRVASETALEKATTAAAAAPPVLPGAEVAGAAKGQSANAIALKEKGEAAAEVAKATALVKANTAALAAAKAKLAAATLGGPAAAAAAAAVSAATIALADSNKYLFAAKAVLVDKTKSLCTAMGAVAYSPEKKIDSLYSYYVEGIRPDIRGEIQSLHNLQESEDFASFVMNKKELDGNSSSVEEYLSYKEFFPKEDTTDRTVFEIFKATSIAVIKNMSLISSANAREQLREQQLDNGSSNYIDSENGRSGPSSGGGGSRNSSQNNSNTSVDTSAAKMYEEDEGKGIDLLTIGLGVGAGYLLAVKFGLRDKLITPTGRAVFSGVMAGLTLLMAKHADSQAEASEKRAELLRKMKAEFNSASSSLFVCKSEDRNDPSKPNCYCYTAEGGRNNNRGNSQICQKLWAQGNFKPGQYLGGANPGVCLDKDKKADPSCKCRQAKSCLRVSMPSISGFDAGIVNMANSAIDPVNRLNNGSSIDSVGIDSAGLETKAARMRDLASKLENEKGMEGYRKNKEKTEKALLANLQNMGKNLPAGSAMGGTDTPNLPSSPTDAVKELEKELENASGYSGDDLIAVPNNMPAEDQPEFGLTEEGALAQETAMSEVMNQDLDYGGNDINKGSNTNIFELLSNRYQRSGMRRLFDEKGEAKPEEAAKSDIAE